MQWKCADQAQRADWCQSFWTLWRTGSSSSFVSFWVQEENKKIDDWNPSTVEEALHNCDDTHWVWSGLNTSHSVWGDKINDAQKSGALCQQLSMKGGCNEKDDDCSNADGTSAILTADIWGWHRLQILQNFHEKGFSIVKLWKVSSEHDIFSLDSHAAILCKMEWQVTWTMHCDREFCSRSSWREHLTGLCSESMEHPRPQVFGTICNQKWGNDSLGSFFLTWGEIALSDHPLGENPTSLNLWVLISSLLHRSTTQALTPALMLALMIH